MNIFDLLIDDKENVSLDDVWLSDFNKASCAQVVREHTFVAQLSAYGLPVVNKILLAGASGCGKTMTAKAIAKALNKKIFILNLSNVISSRLGETSQHIKQVFDKVAKDKAVLFLDEFDQIGKMRGVENESGEMRRLVNTLIQSIDYFPADALLICATNHAEIIDHALLRRFELKLEYQLPNDTQLNNYYDKLLKSFPDEHKQFDRKYDISYAEAKDYAFNLIKASMLNTFETNRSL